MRKLFDARCVGGALVLVVAATAPSCSESFHGDDDAGGASGAGGADEQGGTSGTTGGTGTPTGGNGGTLGTTGEAGAEPTGGTSSGGTDTGGRDTGGTGNGGTQPEGGAGTGPGTPSYRSVVLADEPLAYWRMGIGAGVVGIPNEVGGDNALVLQGSGHELGVTGALRDDVDTALGFDGAASFAVATSAREFDFAERAPFTLECWARRLTGGTSYFQHLLSNVAGSAGSRNGYALYLLPEPAGTDGGRSAFEYDRPATETGLGGPVPDEGTWAHFVATFDGTNARFYVNGTLESTQPIDSAFAARTGAFAVGRAANDARDYFKGAIDEVAVYPRALGIGDVAEHFSYAAR